ncbi:MAG: hypothetical protein PF518_13635 [Spirochaetaceae bacterium]|nr:hypothetical protein [Spirochaetaceae bacterium]
MLITKILRNSLFLIIFSMLLISCEDIFHDASSLLEEISKNSKIQEPRRIFLGGDLYYSFDAKNRDAFITLNGNGNIDGDFLSKSSGVVIGSPTALTKWGVNDIELTDMYIYIGGNFMGYDTSNTYSPDSQFQMVQRYSRDGSFDNKYKPFLNIPGNVEIYAIEALDDSLIAGGNFGPYTASNYSGETELIRFTPDGNGSISTYPSAPDGSYIYSLETLYENTGQTVGGTFNIFDSEAGLSNFAIVADETVVPASSLDLVNFPSSTEVRDSTTWNDTLFIVGNETAMTDGFLHKYVFNGSSFVSDTSFNNAFYGNLTDPTLTFDKVNTVTVDKIGRIYIGGQFSNQQDSNGSFHNNIMRITTTGEIDSYFRADIVSGEVFAIEIQDNGKILVGGQFSTVNGVSMINSTIPINGYIRLQEYGSIDYEFDYGSFSGGNIYSIAIEEES